MLNPRPVARQSYGAPARLLWWLVLAMLLAPALGRIHQVLHPPAWQGQPTLGHVHAQPAAALQSGARQGDAPWLLALFVGHSHSDCQLHDQLNAWASPPMLGQALPAALLQQPPRHVEGRTASAGSAAFFDPRAPPAAA
ncbi:MAG: hypothetical protein RSB42_11005 [Comamonas sp.]